nr:ABC transporter substrate-binding protein [Bradyrhizobium diazoefficiens]
METNSVSKLLLDKFGKKWYFITPDCAFGHTLQQGFEASLKKYDGTEVGASLTPLGSVDFSSYLIKGSGCEPRHHHLSDRGTGCCQFTEAGGAVRPRQKISYRRSTAGA